VGKAIAPVRRPATIFSAAPVQATQVDCSGTILGASVIAGERMKRSLSDPRARQQLADRLERLAPGAKPLWGKMTAPQMVAHLADWMLMAKGELKTAPKKRALRFPPIKQLVIYWLPFPKGVPTAPELITRKPLAWKVERAAVRQHVESWENLNRQTMWPEHPVFGKMTARAWGVLGYRHMDHHLRQFGI
jgi:hypothetical protein